MAVATASKWLTDQIDDITVGKTGYCYILGLTGTIIAHKNFNLVEQLWNTVEQAKSDASMQSTAVFEKMAVGTGTSSVGYYKYKGIHKIASYAGIKTTNWTVIINAPSNEFMGTVNTLRLSMLSIGAIILMIALIIVYLIARAIVKPIQTAVSALRNIAQGEGDLTVRLPVHGNDE
ncbi:MAG: cache domain-containing protein, partial [Treponema sp.]